MNILLKALRRSCRGQASVAGIGLCVLSILWWPVSARAAAVGTATGSLEFEITAPATLPANITLNGGGAGPGHFLFEDDDNSGAGSVTANGHATCAPSGCETNPVGVDFEIQLSNDLTCTANPDGIYGGLEDSFATFGARNFGASPVSLDLRFTTSWSISATTMDPEEDSAEATMFIVWAVPSEFCIELTSCPSGSLFGGTVSAVCPAGSLRSPSLDLGLGSVDTSMGDDSASGPASICDVRVTVLNSGISSGGHMGVTSSCSAISCGLLSLSADTINMAKTEEACQIEAGSNYMVVGPNGDLTLRAGRVIRLTDGFSVGADGQLTLELDPSLLP